MARCGSRAGNADKNNALREMSDRRLPVKAHEGQDDPHESHTAKTDLQHDSLQGGE